MKKILAAALISLLGIGSANADTGSLDGKSLPGHACKPQATQIADFLYQVGGLTNRSFKKRIVVCHIMRDYFDTIPTNALAIVLVYITRPVSAVAPLVCTVKVRNSQTGAVVAAAADSSTVLGNDFLIMGPLTYTGAANSVDMVCNVSERSTIRGIVWSETATTD